MANAFMDSLFGSGSTELGLAQNQMLGNLAQNPVSAGHTYGEMFDYITNLTSQSPTQQQQQQQTATPQTVSTATPSGYVDPWAFQGYYGAQGFIPGQNNGDWSWNAGAPTWAMFLGLGAGQANNQEQPFDPLVGYENATPERVLTQDEQASVDVSDYLSNYFGEGSGYWTNNKAPNTSIEYSPVGGYRQWSDNPTMAGKIMSGVTMAALGAMTGGAGAALGGAAGSAGALAGQALGAAIPSTMQTGLTTGDWNKALINGGTSALGSYLGGTYGKDLNSLFGIGSDSALKGLGSSVINAGTSALGRSALGQPIDGQSILSNIVSNLGSSYIGGVANDAVGGGMLGNLAQGTTGGLSKTTLNALLQGKTPTEQQIIMSLLMGASKPALNFITK